MKALLSLFAGVTATLAVFTGAALAGEAAPMGPIHVTGYIEVAPTAANQMIDMVKQYRDAARGEPGAMAIEIYQEVGAPSRLVTREIWRDAQAADAHDKAASTSALAGKLKPIQYGPSYFRAHAVLSGYSAPGAGAPGSGSVVIISHVDVGPPGIPPLLDLMKPLSESTAKDAGVMTYQILQQTAGARNHFRFFEVWRNERDWEAHNLAKHTQDFRDGSAPLLGTPYDQRTYRLVN